MPEKNEKQLESVESVRWVEGRRTMEEKIYGKDEFWVWSGSEKVMDGDSADAGEDELTCVRSDESDKSLWSVGRRLVKSYCLSYLTYCVGAFELSKSNIHHLSVCWNEAFRKIFGFKRRESVKELQLCCGEMSFKYLYYLAKWNYIVCVSGINNACLSTICHLTRLSLCKGDEF